MLDLLATVLITTMLTDHAVSTDVRPYSTAAICQQRADNEMQDARFRGERAIAGCVHPPPNFPK
jgi:hypothetical protein